MARRPGARNRDFEAKREAILSRLEPRLLAADAPVLSFHELGTERVTRVAITGRNAEKLNEAAKATGAFAIQADVSKEADVERTMREVLAHFGDLDILVNNAGEQHPDTDITDVLDHRHLLDLRMQAMALHRSQHTPFHGFSSDLTEAFLGIDYIVRTNR
mgnify:CR=1 FL=1